MNNFSNLIKKFSEIAPKYESFIFDFNGVLWYGPNRYREAFDTLHKLRDMKKNIYFITNCSSDTRQQYTHYLWNAGFKTSHENVYPVTYFGPAYLKMKYPLLSKVYVIGREGLTHEAKLAGLDVVPGIEDDDKKFLSSTQFDRIFVEDEIEAVIVGEDMLFNFYKMAFASICIQQNNAMFFSCTDDPYDFNGDRNMPSCGALAKSIEVASGRPYQILGKPLRHAVDLIVEKNKLNRKSCLMIGDRINADIVMARDAGIDSCLVLTGVTDQIMIKEELEKKNPISPTYICLNLEMTKSSDFIL